MQSDWPDSIQRVISPYWLSADLKSKHLCVYFSV